MKLNKIKSNDIGVDLGTANVIITLKGKGIILNEPSVIAIDKKTKNVLAYGLAAKDMLGRTPKEILAVKPIQDGVIANFSATCLMLKKMIKKICLRYNVKRPRVVVGIPTEITEVEERAVEESIMQAGAKEVYIIEETMAAAIGANLDVSEPNGNIIVDIGGGTTEIAVISLGGIVVNNSIRVAGDKLNDDIINYVRKNLNLAIGENTAEEIKKQIGCAILPVTEVKVPIRGRDLLTGLPRVMEITSTQVYDAINESILKIIEAVKQALEKTPPELSSDIMERGITIAGGGAMIKGIDTLISMETKMPSYIAENPLDCVAKGAEKTLEDLYKLKEILMRRKMRR